MITEQSPLSCHGIPASPGVVTGKAYVLKAEEISYREELLDYGDVHVQVEKFRAAIKKSRHQLDVIVDSAMKNREREKEEIINVHLAMMDDESFINEIIDKISNELLFAETAIREIRHKYVKLFEGMEDSYMKERATDVHDVCMRLIKNVLDIPISSMLGTFEGAIIIAHDLVPSDTAQLNTNVVKAFCTEIGGSTSHSAIIARMHGIPAIVGIPNLLKKINSGDQIIVDGNKGELYINPNQELLDKYLTAERNYEVYRSRLNQLKDLPSETKDREKVVDLVANIGGEADCSSALENGAKGVGLFRTELLYMGRNALPGENEQFEAYKSVLEKMSPYPVIIRTMDIGGDKQMNCIRIPKEENPFLGWRAIRICLSEKELFKTQLRAILRASVYGNTRMMYPMISDICELRLANGIVKETMEELDYAGISYNRNVPVGVMIEVPSSAICADILIKEADFFSIGTNDLIQYTIAADRMNERVSYLYNPLSPAVLRLIKNVIDASHKAGKWTGMCGEMAGDAAVAPILLGLGLDEFSMSAASISAVKHAIRNITVAEAEEIAAKALQLDHADEIVQLLQAYRTQKPSNSE